jgi:hypothetical protein
MNQIDLRQPAIGYGLALGLASALYLFVFHLMDRALVLNPLVFWSTILFPVTAMILAVRRQRDEQEGRIEQKAALRTAFLSFVLAQLPFSVFIWVLFNAMDPGLDELQRTLMLEAGREVEQVDFGMTVGKVFSQYIYMLLPGFLLSYMVASFMKR